MKNYNFIFLLLALFIVGCTPKVGETTQKVEEKVVDKAKEMTTVESFRSMVPKPGPAPKIQIGTYDQFQLANGLKVIVVENHKLPRVSYQLFVDAPDLQEKEFAGAIDMAGQMLNKGTTTKTKAQIDEEVDFMGASMSSSASGLSGASLTKHTEGLLAIMSDVLLNPSFPVDEFDKMKKQTLSGLASDKDDPDAIANNVASVLRYGKNHPYGEIVTEETVENITLDKCKDYYQNYFQPSISYLVIVGDITKAKAKPMVEQYFGKWKNENALQIPAFQKPKAPKKTTVDFVNKPGAVQSVIAVTYPIDLQPGHPDVIKSRVLNTVLGGFFQSRLMQNLREKHAYTYGSRSRLVNDKTIGYFTAGASVRNEVTDSSVVQLLHELNDIRNTPIPKSDLDMVKNVITGSFARSLARPETVARFALNTARYNLPADYYATYLESLSKVTQADVQAMAKKYIRPENAHIVVVGNKDEVADKLKPFATDGKVTFYDNYGSELEDLEIPKGVTAQTILGDYLNAIGGASKLATVKSIKQEMGMSMQGFNIIMNSYLVDGEKYAMIMSMNGQVMQKQVYDGNKAIATGMEGEKALEGEELEEMKGSTIAFPVLKYAEMGFKSVLTGVEMIEGKKAYKVSVEKPNGLKFTEYYDMETSLKIRTIEATGETVDLFDYKAINGILFPHLTKVSGGQAPMPMEMKTTAIEVNGSIDESVFKIK